MFSLSAHLSAFLGVLRRHNLLISNSLLTNNFASACPPVSVLKTAQSAKEATKNAPKGVNVILARGVRLELTKPEGYWVSNPARLTTLATPHLVLASSAGLDGLSVKFKQFNLCI